MPAYSNTGPFTTNAAPGISATFLNNIENFLDSIMSASYDSHVSSDGSGNVTVVSLKLATGTIHALAWGFTSGLTNAGQTITHGLGGIPTAVFTQFEAGTTNTTTLLAYISNLTATTFLIATNTPFVFTVRWLAIR